MADEYKDLADPSLTSEELPPEATTTQSARRLIPPGRYISPSRTTKVKIKKEDGNLVAELTSSERLRPVAPRDRAPLPGELDRTYFTPRTYVATTVFERREGSTTVKTSTAAEYLRSCGVKVPQSGKVDLWTAAFAEAQARPVGYRIGWENRTDKGADGKYPKATKRTAFFNRGTKENPDFHTEVEEDGISYEARDVVEGFFKV